MGKRISLATRTFNAFGRSESYIPLCNRQLPWREAASVVMGMGRWGTGNLGELSACSLSRHFISMR